MRDVTFTAADISCEHCRKTIQGGLAEKQGVGGVVVDIDARTIHVQYDDAVVDEDALRAELDELGYPVDPTG